MLWTIGGTGIAIGCGFVLIGSRKDSATGDVWIGAGLILGIVGCSLIAIKGLWILGSL